MLRERLLDVLAQLVPTAAEPDWQPLVLDNDRLDLAVARGAAYYGMVRRGAGRADRRRAGPHLLHRRRERAAGGRLPGAGRRRAGPDVDLTERRFDLLVSEPVEFPLYVSSTRLTDRPGELVPIDREQMTPLPPIRTVLRTTEARASRTTVSVDLHARLTEIGTLDLWCSEVDGPAELAAAVRRPLGHADRHGRPRVGRRERRRARRSDLAGVPAADRRHLRARRRATSPTALVKRLAAGDRHAAAATGRRRCCGGSGKR